MAQDPIADRYAEALVTLVMERPDLEAAAEAVRAIARRAVPDREARLFWRSRRAGRQRQSQLVRQLLDAVAPPDIVRSFVEVLFANNRLSQLPEITRALDEKVAERLGRTVAQVTSARPMNDKQQEALRRRLREISGKEVHLVTEVREDLIGGLRVRLENTVIDGSVGGRLEALTARFGP